MSAQGQFTTDACQWQAREQTVRRDGKILSTFKRPCRQYQLPEEQRQALDCSTSKTISANWQLSLLLTAMLVIANNNLISTAQGGQQQATRGSREAATMSLARPQDTKSSRTFSEAPHFKQIEQTSPGQPPPEAGGFEATLPRHRRSSGPGLLMAINELRVSGSKSEPPSRPSVDWSKQRPYFGPELQRNVSVELGKTAYLTCKVYELGDKTVSWLRPRENEILTVGRYTYISDPRFASINDNGSHDWILEIKDVGLNDSTSYECQVSTDPKMSTIINLQVKASKAKIKQGEQFYASVGANIEFTCETGLRHQQLAAMASSVQQTYWYFNGDLLNYARAHSISKNFSIEWDPMTQTSRFKLPNLQLSDAGNYTCKPTSAEPTTIRLHVKKPHKGSLKDRTHHSSPGTSNGYLTASAKDWPTYQRNRQQHEANSNALDPADSAASSVGPPISPTILIVSIMANLITVQLGLVARPRSR